MFSRLVWCAPSCERSPGSSPRSKSVPKIAGSICDQERRTGLSRAYTSRVENGHTVPGVATLEKYAGALGVPLYRFFTDGPVEKPKLPESESDAAWGSSGKDRREFHLFAKAFTRMSERDQKILTAMAQKMVDRHAKPNGRPIK
jgi:transcriptional regulator with XRE-family HTH domain